MSKAKDSTDWEPEWVSWALSCVTELCRGDEANRKKMHESNGVPLVVNYMQSFPDDIFVQWQGVQAIGAFGCEEAIADDFGKEGAVEWILDCMKETDCSELM